MILNFTLNNEPTQWRIDPGEYLLDALRRHGIVSPKRACDHGVCGACTVLMNQKPILSCSLLAAKADAQHITTIEGVTPEITEIAHYINREGAEQCGYCSPGLALTILAMSQELKNPSDDEIKHYLAGNLCRCSGYMGQLRGIRHYLEAYHE